MQWNWVTIVMVQVFIWSIVFLEWKQFKKAPKKDKITFSAILLLSAIFSLLHLENLPGPITLLRIIFAPFVRMME